MLGSSAMFFLNSSRGTATAYRLCRGRTTSFLPFLSKTPQIFSSVGPISDSPFKVNGVADLFQRHIHNSPTSFTSSGKDATISKQCQEFESSNDHDVQQPTNLVKESCFGSLSSQADVNVSKPDQKNSEWSLFEAKKLQDKVESDQILSRVAQVEVRQQDLLDKQAKMEIMLGELSEWKRKILHTLELGDKRQQDTGLPTSQAKMKKMMKKILASQMKMGQVEDTINRAHSKCSELMENQILQILQRLEGMEATQRRSFSMYEEMEYFIKNTKYEDIDGFIRNSMKTKTSSSEIMTFQKTSYSEITTIQMQILQRLKELEAAQIRNFSKTSHRLEELATALRRNFSKYEEMEHFIRFTKYEDIESFIRNNRKKETSETRSKEGTCGEIIVFLILSFVGATGLTVLILSSLGATGLFCKFICN